MGMFEPSADARIAAANLWGMYTALRNEGFTEEQAMAIILEMVAN